MRQDGTGGVENGRQNQAATVAGDTKCGPPWDNAISSQGAPPAADALDCKSSRVVIYAEIYPARIRRKIVNAIGRNLAEFRDLEIVNPHRLRPSLRPQLASAILEVADQLFFLGGGGIL